MSLAAAAAIATIAGSAISAYGSLQAAKAAEAEGEYQAAVARNNKIIQERAAVDVRERGDIEARLHSQEINQLVGAQRAAFAGAGVEVDTGSAARTVEDTEAAGAYEKAVIRADAERAAYEYETRGMNYGAQAELSLLRGRNQASALRTQAAATVISGAGRAASTYKTLS